MLATLSSEAVTENKTLLQDAIKWYKDELSQQNPWTHQHIDKQFSLFPSLDDKVEKGGEITGDIYALLSSAIKEYEHFLREDLQKEHWINGDKVEDELSKIEKISKDLEMNVAARGLREA